MLVPEPYKTLPNRPFLDTANLNCCNSSQLCHLLVKATHHKAVLLADSCSEQLPAYQLLAVHWQHSAAWLHGQWSVLDAAFPHIPRLFLQLQAIPKTVRNLEKIRFVHYRESKRFPNLLPAPPLQSALLKIHLLLADSYFSEVYPAAVKFPVPAFVMPSEWLLPKLAAAILFLVLQWNGS